MGGDGCRPTSGGRMTESGFSRLELCIALLKVERGLGRDGKRPVSAGRFWEDFGSPPASPELHFSRLSSISAMQRA